MEHDLHLSGPVVSLVPLAVEHADQLAALGDAEAYAWNTSPPPLTTSAAFASIYDLQLNPTVMAFAVTSTDDGELRGMTTFYEHAPAVPRVEIGHTFYGRRFWGGDTNPHTKLLMPVALRLSRAGPRTAAVVLGVLAAGSATYGATWLLGPGPP